MEVEVYHPPGAFKYLSYVRVETVIKYGELFEDFICTRDDKLVPKHSHMASATWRRSLPKWTSKTVNIPILTREWTNANKTLCVKYFGYKNIYCITAARSDGGVLSVDVTKNQYFLTWKGSHVKLRNLRVGNVLIVEEGIKAVITSIQYIGYHQTKEVLSREPTLFLANGFICPNRSPCITKRPATSYGLIAYRFIRETRKFEVLIVRRKHTMGFMDLLRGRYYNRSIDAIVNIFLSEMTEHEREILRTKTFDEMWNDIWVNHKSKSYRTEYSKAKQKFELLDLTKLLDQVTTGYKVPEYGFPKGRKNKHEATDMCAKREFEEETGLSRRDYTVIKSAPIFEEKFVGTNGVNYRHVYYLARVSEDVPPPVIDMYSQQYEEISAVEWRTVDECMQLFRSYDLNKRRIALDVQDYLDRNKP
jgi:8-oxo-dGTP pyrophosphatase MutT (NUDIX family)